jgi:predicted nucleic acid-binding protein
MVAADSSTLIAFIQGQSGADTQLLQSYLQGNSLILPPMVLAELLSEPQIPAGHAEAIRALPLLEIHEGYWLRAAQSRAKILSLGLRTRLPDTLIAQSCIDHDVALITRDGDFRHFAKHCGLKLA